jgi:hypothetical protein
MGLVLSLLVVYPDRQHPVPTPFAFGEPSPGARFVGGAYFGSKRELSHSIRRDNQRRLSLACRVTTLGQLSFGVISCLFDKEHQNADEHQ